MLEILDRHRGGTIRGLGAGHAWSPGIETDDTLVDMGAFNNVRVDPGGQGGNPTVTAGAGVRIKEILAHLERHGLTLPSLGLITEQTIAGATATGTHGSGRSSLSHYVRALRVACYDDRGHARIHTLQNGVELAAGRCSLGCLGLVLEVTLETVPRFWVEEWAQWADRIDTVLSWEDETPLQQFYLIPEGWRYLAQRRRVVSGPSRGGAPAYRLYWFTLIDISLHLLLKLFASVLRSRALIRLLYRRILPAFVFPRWRVVDRSDRQLVMEHELFRHLELELFVQQRHVTEAAEVVQDVLRTIADRAEEPRAGPRDHLAAAGLMESWSSLRGSYVHHYPICIRRVCPDDTLISMSSCAGLPKEDWYAISLITYQTPRGPFQAVAALLATLMEQRFDARIHWGKWFPHTSEQVEARYPALDDFRAVCRRLDPRGVFRNDFLNGRLFPGDTPPGPT